MINKLKIWYQKIYHQMMEINDTPLKKSLGLGIGVFLGILPGVGPIAALTLALIFRVNRAAAVLGSVLTNTWLSILTFVLSIKIGSSITGADWNHVYRECKKLLNDFQWRDLFNSSVFLILKPLFIGYTVVSFCIGLIVTL